ncbi:hypothetical protein N7463_000879 [Penicillium fimorum]|uniref:Acyl-CoA dehydrogenase n=1 Tax=Penicillium fimorum TaxID=1882269 RepID=A0A9W9Y5A1_9EURO|nr:hypothetical protein N7463_000879 [Penicillium fimorum]
MREWIDTNIVPKIAQWESLGTVPDEVYKACATAGLLMPMAAGSKIPKWWAEKYPVIGGIDFEGWNGFHDFIVHDEMTRVGSIGIPNGLIGGVTLCIPAIRKHGRGKALYGVIDEVLSGDKRISLAVTEPEAGSDVRGILTEAVLSEDKCHYIVNGQKKWITAGMYANYFLTLTRTSGDGFTLLVIPKADNVTVRPMEMCGSSCAGTAFVEFDDAQVPVNYRVGEEGKGLSYIMSNFNHERLFISFQSLRLARVCLEDSIGHAITREAFGKRLVDQAVVRFKLANMARETEALQAWIESLVYQLDALSEEKAVQLLAGQTAQLKAHSGIVLEKVVSQAIQIMGDLGLTKGGRGERLERIWRDVKAITIPGGSEDILLDLSVRRALAVFETENNAGHLSSKI